MTKLKIAAAGLLAATTLATAGVVAVGAGRTDEPKPAMTAPGAPKETTAVAPVLPRDDRPNPKSQPPTASGPGIEGRIVNLEGRPVAGAQVGVSQLWSPPEDGPDRSPGRPAAPGSRLGRWLDQVRDRGVQYPSSGLVSSPTNQTATTDRDGRFRLTGVGPDQLAEIFVSGPTIATAELYAMSRDGDEVRAALHGFRAPPRSSTTPDGSSTPSRPVSRSRAWSATGTAAGPSPGSLSAPPSSRSTA